MKTKNTKICSKCKIEKSLVDFYRQGKYLRSNCKNCTNVYNKQYKLDNKNYYKEYKTDVNFRLSSILRTRLRIALKNNAKSGSAVSDLGCSVQYLRDYLESKFEKGMTWKNHGLHGWHIDHVVPLSKFDLTNRNELLEACNYKNMQPLWAKDNLLKSNNYVFK